MRQVSNDLIFNDILSIRNIRRTDKTYVYTHVERDGSPKQYHQKDAGGIPEKTDERKPLHALTVKEITEKCGMHRQTFYYHFEDVHDLVRWMYEEEAFDLLMRSEEVLCWQDKILQLFGYISANREMCVCTLNSLSRETLKDFFTADLERIVRDVVLAYGRDLPSSEGYVEYLTHFYTAAFAGIVESWILGEIDLSPEMIVAYMEQTIADQLNGAVMRYEKGGGAEQTEKKNIEDW